MDRLAILEEIHQYAEPPALADDEVTITQYAEYAGITRRQAETRLSGMVRDGVAKRRNVLFKNNRCWAYKLVGG